MKKTVAIFLSIFGCVSICLNFSGCELFNSTDGTEALPPANPTMVTEQEWLAAFDYSDENYVEIYKVSSGFEEFEAYNIGIEKTTKGTVDKFEIKAVISGFEEETTWVSIENGKVYSYEKVNDNEYSKTEGYGNFTSAQEWTAVANIKETAAEAFDYGYYAYDETEKAYKADRILSDDKEVARNCQFKFENGKLIFASLEYNEIEGFSIFIELSLTYGNAEVTLPTNIIEKQ